MCIFYLVLRGLDTVEDDMSLAKVASTIAPRQGVLHALESHALVTTTQEIKLPALKAFYKSIYKADFSMARRQRAVQRGTSG